MPRYKDKVAQELADLEFDDLIQVTWLDASKIYHVTEDKIEENAVFATYKRVTGNFHSLKRDHTYSRRFIIIKTDLNHKTGRYTVVSIPVGCVTKVRRLRDIEKIKETGNVGSPMNTNLSVKLRQVEEPFEVNEDVET